MINWVKWLHQIHSLLVAKWEHMQRLHLIMHNILLYLLHCHSFIGNCLFVCFELPLEGWKIVGPDIKREENVEKKSEKKNRKWNRLSMRKVKYTQELPRCHMEDQGVRPCTGQSSSVSTDCNPRGDFRDKQSWVLVVELIPDTCSRLTHLFLGCWQYWFLTSHNCVNQWAWHSGSCFAHDYTPPQERKIWRYIGPVSLDCQPSCNRAEGQLLPLSNPASLSSLKVYLFNHSPINCLHARYVSK